MDHTTQPSIKEQVAQVPQEPGCYLWKNSAGEVLYVGKAKNLRARMRQYVNGDDTRAKIPRMMREVAGFDYVVVNSEHEALVLELNLIQQYHPSYNVALMDDKSYPFIAVTESDVFPALKYTREKHKKGVRYFGPYTDARAARAAIEVVRRVCPLCVATCAEWKRTRRLLEAHKDDLGVAQMLLAEKGRPCFDAHVGRGPGACMGVIAPEEYAKNVQQVEEFLSGKRSAFVGALEDEMLFAAQNLDFERAGRAKRRLEAVRALEHTQKVVFSTSVDCDLVGIWREETIAEACVFCVREGRLVRTVEFTLTKGMDVPQEELVGAFLKRYYHQSSEVPPEVNVPELPEDQESLEAWLSGRAGRRVRLHVPVRGDKKQLLEMATTNAKHALSRYKVRTGYDDKRTNAALLELESALALDEPPLRIECFDISTIHGAHTVASMVVFENGRPAKDQYRRFKIRTPLDEANDVASMAEVLGRRYSPERMEDARFGRRPDLLIVDGGKPQLTAAREQLAALGLDINVAGLAKSDEELFVPWDETPVVLPSGSASLYLVKRVRDEAHRFAITYHRELRDKAMTLSILDEVPGVGPARKKALKKRFGSMKRLCAATVEELAQTPGVSEQVAQNVYDTLAAWQKEREDVVDA